VPRSIKVLLKDMDPLNCEPGLILINSETGTPPLEVVGSDIVNAADNGVED
jgi:hypothetical protein